MLYPKTTTPSQERTSASRRGIAARDPLLRVVARPLTERREGGMRSAAFDARGRIYCLRGSCSHRILDAKQVANLALQEW